jgi:hypothetical protein
MLVFVKQHLVQIGRVDGPIESLSEILAAIRLPGHLRADALETQVPAIQTLKSTPTEPVHFRRRKSKIGSGLGDRGHSLSLSL